jgi:hypothetical protein
VRETGGRHERPLRGISGRTVARARTAAIGTASSHSSPEYSHSITIGLSDLAPRPEPLHQGLRSARSDPQLRLGYGTAIGGAGCVLAPKGSIITT